MAYDDETFAKALSETAALRDAIYQLRGRFISEMTTLESMLDNAILFYFGQNLPAEEFRSFLLSRIHASDKIDVVGAILKSIGLLDPGRRLLQALRTANSFRNELAHSSVGASEKLIAQVCDTGDEDRLVEAMLFDLHSIRSSRFGVIAKREDLEELRNRLDSLETLQSWVVFIMFGVLAHSNGHNAMDAIKRMETANPKVPKLTELLPQH